MHITNGWLDAAIDGHYGIKASSRNGRNPKYVVMHGTAGGSSAEGIDDFFTNGKDANGQPVQASAHFIIGQDGTIIQGISCDMAAWANCCLSGNYASYLDTSINQNDYTISIEHCKPGKDNSDALTDAQTQASFELTRCICEAYSIPMRAGDSGGGIISHADIDVINRARCPGNYPWDELWAYLSNGGNTVNTTPYGQGKGDFDIWFTVGSDGNWTCKQTGAVLMGGNKGLYIQLSIDGNSLPVIGLPIESEQYQPDGTSRQRCERGVMIYDPKSTNNQPGMGNCYLGFVDYNQSTTTNAPPAEVIADIKKVSDAITQLIKDAGM